jgi:hypothetical protein
MVGGLNWLFAERDKKQTVIDLGGILLNCFLNK